MRPTFEALHDNPDLLRSLLAEARRERARAVHEILVAPVLNLFRPARTPRAASPSAC